MIREGVVHGEGAVAIALDLAVIESNTLLPITRGFDLANIRHEFKERFIGHFIYIHVESVKLDIVDRF